MDRRCRESEGEAKIEGYMSVSDEEAHHRLHRFLLHPRHITGGSSSSSTSSGGVGRGGGRQAAGTGSGAGMTGAGAGVGVGLLAGVRASVGGSGS